MDIHITLEGSHDLVGQIYRHLRGAIIDGRLAAGVRLPSTRDLAVQLGVSRKTTLEVFERLGAEGYLYTRPGDGTFVAEGFRAGGKSSAMATPEPSGVRPAARWAQMPEALAIPRPGSVLAHDFQGGVTDKSQFPFEAWRRCIHHALRAQARGRGAYRDPAGEQELRLAIARYLAYSRALTPSWEQVVVTQGAQQALDLLARVVLEPGDVVAVEEPGYPPARACFAAMGAKTVSVPVDGEGIVVERLPDAARLVYVTPSHQFPLGMPMSLRRRLALLEWAHRRAAVVIEDDYDGEFRFEGRPVESLKSLDQHGLVAYVGTFSKTLFPELRVGYLVPPESLMSALHKAKQLGDWHSCSLTQTALARFMLDGDFAKHLRRVHKHYTASRDVLVRHLKTDLSPWLEPEIPVAGIHLAARLKAGLREAEVIAAAREAAVGLYGISNFYADTEPVQGLMLGYGGIGPEAIGYALGRLADVLSRLAPVG